MPTSPPAGWYFNPDGSGGQRYWDGQHWTKHCRAEPSAPRSPLRAVASGARRSWSGIPPALRLILPIALVLTLLGIGFAVWVKSPRDDWARLPKRLNCHLQDGPKPPDNLTVASVDVGHPRSGVLQLVVRFAQPLPQSPAGNHASGFVGYVLTYSVANNGKKFVELGPEEGTDDLAIIRAQGPAGAPASTDASMRPDRDTNARRITPDTMQINLELKRLGVDNQPVIPELTVDSQFNTPSTTTVQYASQVCRG
ncbi:hypothetical protein B1987_11180 [Mycobacterium kansasii]|uniref:DUF2510 domain-containing protein n=1 Tax=Mycobacterium attenuatum TaxID=2341086 RepID=A0A498QEX1_9MYCO|nr:DUF2510 domain-containing protein [Mycobacterium attenuatum]ORB87441.1 hypothetical protein B1987_11180 [Mycobacterium kansasii]VBA43045.1 hypothetical protein LAUMK136_04883 [Mycobacterium attenuatum]VBA61655.1 hypothetical protein LAUMK41_05037 [Mycobacterium attenuatum]